MQGAVPSRHVEQFTEAEMGATGMRSGLLAKLVHLPRKNRRRVPIHGLGRSPAPRQPM
jgi:hypothetical protein